MFNVFHRYPPFFLIRIAERAHESPITRPFSPSIFKYRLKTESKQAIVSSYILSILVSPSSQLGTFFPPADSAAAYLGANWVKLIFPAPPRGEDTRKKVSIVPGDTLHTWIVARRR